MTRQALARALLGLLGMLACAQAAPLAVPFGLGDDDIAAGQQANYQTLYPNAQVGPDMCRFEELGDANIVAIHNTAVPNTDKVLFLELPYARHPLVDDGKGGAVLDPLNPTDFEPVEMAETVFCSGHTFTKDGGVVVVGGHVSRNISLPGGAESRFLEGLDGVRILNSNESLQLDRRTTMASKRWYPSTVLLADGKIMISGGVQGAGNGHQGANTYELFDPDNPAAAMPSFDLDATYVESFTGKPFYPFLWTLPTGHVLMLADVTSCILNPKTGECVREAGQLVSPAPRPGGWSSHYPFTGSAVMLTLVPNDDNEVTEVELVIFGGSRKADHPGFPDDWKEGFDPEALGARESHRVKLSWSRAGPADDWKFTFGDWVSEDMGYPRVMPDSTLLPNGDVVVMNGAQRGVAGYPVKGGTMSLCQVPAFWASLYQPDRDQDERITLLCGSKQPRMYHASASLTTEGKILVAGADRNRMLRDSGVPWFNGTGATIRPAYNIEVFHPPYVFDTDNKPDITSVADAAAGATPEISYGQTFTVEYGPAEGASGDVNVTSVVLVAPSSNTHSMNFNQRVVRLLHSKSADGQLSVTAPANPGTAPPQYYMLFVNNGKTYSTGKWVKLVDRDGLGDAEIKP